MPPAVVKTIEEEIFWQYAKLISKSAGLGNQRAFQMNRFMALRDGKIKWSTAIREYIKEHENHGVCIYCNTEKSNLSTEHILPKSCGGPDIADNAIRVCMNCNDKKNGRRLYEWYGLKNNDKIPRIAEGKYLKLLYSMHEKNGTLKTDRNMLLTTLCAKCNLKSKCEQDSTEGALSVYCLEGSFS